MNVFTRYSLPTNVDRDQSYFDTLTPNGSGGGTFNWATINLTTDTTLVLRRAYWELNRDSSNSDGLYMYNFGESSSGIGTGRYTGVIGQEGNISQQGVTKKKGFRCVVKFDEQIY